jgi:high-affinity K+ transport system ATPase subunit B
MKKIRAIPVILIVGLLAIDNFFPIQNTLKWLALICIFLISLSILIVDYKQQKSSSLVVRNKLIVLFSFLLITLSLFLVFYF